MFRRVGRDPAATIETSSVGAGPRVVVVEGDGALTYRLSDTCPEFNIEQAQHVDDAIKGALGDTIVVLGPDASTSATLDRVEDLSELSPTAGLTVILAVAKITTPLLRRALRAGISDVVDVASSNDLEDAVRRIAARSALRHGPATEHGGRGRIVAVFSPKGGVGTTTIAINLAALSRPYKSSNVIIDADLPFGDVAIGLGVEPANSLGDATGSDLDMARLAGLFASPTGSDIRALVAPPDPARSELITAADVTRTLELCRETAHIVVVDTTSAFDDITLAVLESADEIVIVGSTDLATIKNVKIALQTFRQLGIPDNRMQVVLNRVSAHPALRVADIDKVLGVETFSLPEDQAVGRAAVHAAPVVLEAPKAAFSRALTRLAERLQTAEVLAMPA